jgi:hypothetical protein
VVDEGAGSDGTFVVGSPFGLVGSDGLGFELEAPPPGAPAPDASSSFS